MIFRIIKVIQETPDTKSFVLENSTGEKLHYKSGQFLTFRFYDRNGTEVRRSYSISSSPELDEPLKITVKRVSNGIFSRLLHDILGEGGELDCIGVSGFFVLPDDVEAYERIVFFAAGSGIAPIYGLIKTLLHQHPTKPVVLIFSNRNERHTVFYDELITLKNKFPDRFEIEFLFSSAKDLSRARLNYELVENFVYKYSPASHLNVLYYLCGPYDYMRMINIKLLTEGVPEDQIRKEIFFVQKVAEKELPPDIFEHKIHLQLNSVEYIFSSQYPTTILQAAKRLKIAIPFSCEAGQCGTCAATCLDGKVWMSHNEVLLDHEIKTGKVLTCTGYAVGGDVRLVIK